LIFKTRKPKIRRIKQKGEYVQKKGIKIRRRVNRMYFEEGRTKCYIAQKTGMSKNFVIRWTQTRGQDFTEDNRGWKKGNMRKWEKDTAIKVKQIHDYLSNNPNEFFRGATAIENEWRHRYPGTEIPPLRTIGKMLSDLGLSDKRRVGRRLGATRYLCYPEYTINSLLGGRVVEADFIRKNLSARTEPLHFIGFSFKIPPKLRHYIRTEGETSLELMKACDVFFRDYEKPDYIKVDNGAAMSGSAYLVNKRNISKFMKHMIDNGVNPIFSVPRRPFSQASIEGNNSVFSRKFWNRRWFVDLADVDMQLQWFNEASIKYTGYKKPATDSRKIKFEPKVYFIRQVREDTKNETGYITVLNDDIKLEPSYINYFVLAEWDIVKEKLYVRYEIDKTSQIIKEVKFRINSHSKKTYKMSG
jgi:hypothetical protein